MCTLIIWSRLFFLRQINNQTFNLFHPEMSFPDLLPFFSLQKRSTARCILNCPAPEKSNTFVSGSDGLRYTQNEVNTLILEDAHNAATQSTLPHPPLHSPLLFISASVTYSQAHCFQLCWQLLFTLISPNCSKA